MEPFIVTRTNGKRYVGFCGYDLCSWSTDAVQLRLTAQENLRAHVRITHGASIDTLFQRSQAMKQPSADLPDLGEKLSEYADHLVVFSDAHPGERDTSFGKRPTMETLCYVFLDGVWKNLGETPVFFRTVNKQITEAGDEPIGGVLIQGTDRNDREWYLAPVPRTDKVLTAALKGWDKDKAEAF